MKDHCVGVGRRARVSNCASLWHGAIAIAAVVSSSRTAAAQEGDPGTAAPSSKTREASAIAKPTEAPPPGPVRFEAEPMRDVPITMIAASFAGLLDVIVSTGEVRPQQISPTFDTNSLFFLDRVAVHQTFASDASTLSNAGLALTLSYAVLDPVATGFRERNVQAGIVDGIMYAESAAITWGLTNLAKIAVRRPRPLAYAEAEQHKGDPNYSNSDTDSSLSFFSGHASMCAAMTATATYLAFARSPHSARPWITLLVGTAVTTFVSVERVRAGAHFPTDVIAGAVAGAGIGTLVPHFHRFETEKQRPLWVGFAPASLGEGATASLIGRF